MFGPRGLLKNVWEQILQVQGTTWRPWTLTGQGPGQDRAPGRWLPAVSRAYFLIRRRVWSFIGFSRPGLLPSSLQPPPSTGPVPEPSEHLIRGRNENPCDWVCSTLKCVRARLPGLCHAFSLGAKRQGLR